MSSDVPSERQRLARLCYRIPRHRKERRGWRDKPGHDGVDNKTRRLSAPRFALDMPKGASISYGRTFITPSAMRVATLTAGYADGYPRHLSNVGAEMLVRGKRCPLLGRVTMDLMVIDVSHIPDVDVGDEVVLMGKQGDAEIPCVELSGKAGTITWEITTRIGQRVKRLFV